MFSWGKQLRENDLMRRRPAGPVGARVSNAALLAAILVQMCGCRPAPLPFPASLNSQRPEERVRAIKTAVNYPYAAPEDRRAVIELLVARLEDEDDAVRFFAILALEKMTGTRLGYEYHAPVNERLRAVQAWRRYLDREARLAREESVSGPTENQDARPAADFVSGRRGTGG